MLCFSSSVFTSITSMGRTTKNNKRHRISFPVRNSESSRSVVGVGMSGSWCKIQRELLLTRAIWWVLFYMMPRLPQVPHWSMDHAACFFEVPWQDRICGFPGADWSWINRLPGVRSWSSVTSLSKQDTRTWRTEATGMLPECYPQKSLKFQQFQQ